MYWRSRPEAISDGFPYFCDHKDTRFWLSISFLRSTCEELTFVVTRFCTFVEPTAWKGPWILAGSMDPGEWSCVFGPISNQTSSTRIKLCAQPAFIAT